MKIKRTKQEHQLISREKIAQNKRTVLNIQYGSICN